MGVLNLLFFNKISSVLYLFISSAAVFTPIIPGLGTVDICGGLYVLNETYLNQDTGIRGQLDVCANIVGENNIIGLSGEIIGQGNSVFVNYKYFDHSDFPTTSTSGNPNTLSPNWCIIAELDGNGLVNNSCIFQIIDRSDGVDVNLTFILGVNEVSSPICSLNVLENNYSNNYPGTPGFFIRNLRVVRVQTGSSFTTQKFYLQLDRVAYANSSTTRLDVRTYLNTQNVQSGSDPVYPWILGSYGNTLPSGTTIIPLEVNLQQQSENGTKCNVVTNAYSVNLNGGKAILTSKTHKTGSDRIFECFEKLDLIDINYIINLQGDEPNIDLNDLKHLYKLININKPEIGTMAAKIENKSKLNDENVVKVITENKITNKNFPIALNFKRRLKDEIINIYHHIGIYAFKPEILKKIINLKQTKNEIKNRLEQLRAMENRIKINVALAKFSPIGIDTMEDYLALKKLLEYNS